MTDKGPHPYSKYGTLGLEPCALLAVTTTPPIVPQNPSLLFFQSLASTERSELGNGVGGTGAAAQKRFYLIAYVELFPAREVALKTPHSAAGQDRQAGSREEGGVRAGTQVQAGAMQAKLRRQGGHLAIHSHTL